MMKQTRTRILSLLLALVMCLSLLPVTAMAAGGSSGEPALFLDPWNIGSFGPVAVDPFLQPQIVPAGRPESAPYTVRLLDQDSGKVIETSDSYEAWQTLNLRNRYGTTGYDFVSITPGTAHSYDPDKKILTYYPQDNIDITIRSYYLDFDHTITFDLNGAGSTQTEKVKNGSPSIPKPADPTLPGYRFLGWYEGEPGSDGYLHSYCLAKFDQVVSKDRTFYAMWEKEETTAAVRVTFYPNGGRITEFKGKTVPAPNSGYPFTVDDVTGVDMNSGIGWTNTDSSGLLATTALPSVERDGYTFDGWYFTGTGPESNQAYDGKLTDFSKLTIFDSSKKISGFTELAAKWVASGETYTVKFDLNGASGTAPAPRKAEKGKTVVLPQLSAPNGYRFLGWGTSADGKAFTPWNAANPVNSDLTLYALWDYDRFDFLNSYGAFDPSKSKTYLISGKYLEALKSGLEPDQWEEVSSLMNSKWEGSCFGMSALYCLRYADRIDPAKFQSGAAVLHDFTVPVSSSEVWNLINYYFLQQRRPESSGFSSSDLYENYDNHKASGRNNACYAFRDLIADGTYSRCLVEDLTNSKLPSVICFTFDGEDGQSGHAVVGLDCAKTASGYSISIWDPNDNQKNDTLTISSDFKTAAFSSGNYKNAVIHGSLPTKDAASTFDHLNIQNYTGTNVSQTTAGTTNMTSLETSLDNFTVTAADGTYAEIKNGDVVAGTLKMAIGITLAAKGGNSGHSYALPSSSSYTVKAVSDSKGTIALHIPGYYVALDSEGVKELSVTNNGQVTVSSDKAAGQTLSVTSSQLGDTWNSLTVAGTDTGFTVDISKENVKIASENNASVSIVGRNVFSDAKSRSQNITASASGTAVAMNSLGTGTQQPAGNNPFTDVKAGAYYYDAVLWAVEKKVTSGTSATTFSPDDSCTRGQIVTFLWRAAGSPKPTSSTNPFTDVKEGAYYYDAVLWAVEQKITSGTSATTFSPDASCTRGQTVTFLYRAAGSPKVASSANPFTDVKPGTYYYDAVLWAVEKKVTSGTSATTFSPDATVTRGQTVTFLYRSQGDK